MGLAYSRCALWAADRVFRTFELNIQAQAPLMIEKIEVHVIELPVKRKRIFPSESYDTGYPSAILSRPMLVKIRADRVVGCTQIRPISPGHFLNAADCALWQ
jgi:hypothetical protein